MTNRNRIQRKSNLHLESLESREAPTVGISSAWQAALAQAQNMGPRAIHFQGVQRALPIARPGTTYQGPTAVSLGGVSNANSANAVAGLPTGRAALLAQMQARRAALRNASLGANATPRRPWMAAASLRLPPRTPEMPTATPTSPTVPTTPMTPTNQTNDDGTTAQNLPPNVSGVLNVVYQNFVTNSNQPTETGPGSVQIVGSNVGVNIHGNGQGDFSDLLGSLRNLGMEIVSTNAATWTVSGMLPIDQLPTAAQIPQTLSITPRLTPLRM